MDFNFIRGATSKELEQFKAVCNQLLSRTYYCTNASSAGQRKGE